MAAVLAGGAGFSPAADIPATAPSAIIESQIHQAIRQLGDRDFRVRERATRTLWAAGETAVPALKDATGADDPEISRRAKTILANISFGVTPDMSRELIELMNRYRAGDAGVKRQVAGTLTNHGARGARVLLKMREEEADPAVRGAVSELLLRQSRELAVALIGEGDEPSAGKLLAVAAESGDERAAMNYAAFLLVRGGLGEAIVSAKAELADADAAARLQADAVHEDAAARAMSVATRLAYLHRAAGDPASAQAMAQRSGNEQLIWNTRIESGDWSELANRAAAAATEEVASRQSVPDLAFAAAFHRLSGDEVGVDRFAKQLQLAADRQPEQSWNAAEGLLINGRVDLGIDVLVKHGHLADAAEFAIQRLAFEDVARLVERARAGETPQLGRIQVKAARAMWFTGDEKNAADALERAAKECETKRDLEGLIEAAGAAVEMGLGERAQWCVIAVMNESQRVQPGAPPGFGVNLAAHRARMAELFAQVRFRDAERAAGWWQVLRQRFPRDPAGKTLEKLRALDKREMSPVDLEALCTASRVDAQRRPPEARDAQLELIADTLADAGRREAAGAVYVELANVAAQTNPARVASSLSKLAALDAERGWRREAAEKYHRAWQIDPGNPVLLYLSGLMLSEAGDASVGGQRMARAHLIPLADQNARYNLYELLADRKLTEEAKREREFILRTAEFMSWRRSEALRRAGDDAHAAGDAARAGDLWERAFLDNNSEPTKFVQTWANVSMPALVRRTRAIGLIQAGDVSLGVREAEAALAAVPGDADGLIEVVAALDAKGATEEADALFKRFAGRYKALCETYPRSGPLNNLYAWAAAKCHRELDDALKHAKRAVEFQPANTASLDTLAETHFQRREFAPAIAAMQRCAELEPDEPRHKEQLDRFRKAQAEAKRNATSRPALQ